MRDAAADLAICEAATPGPWYTEPTGERINGFSRDLLVAGVPGRQMVYAKPPGGAFPAADQRFIATAREALPYWIREAQAWKERAERAEKEREAVIKLVLDNYSFCPVDVVCLAGSGPSCRECLETAIRKQLAQEVGKDG